MVRLESPAPGSDKANGQWSSSTDLFACPAGLLRLPKRHWGDWQALLGGDVPALGCGEWPAAFLVDALAAAKPSHVDYISLFDVYRGRGIESGKKSLAILVLMQDTQRTLTDAEIDATVAALLRVVEDRFGGSLRR